MSEAGKLSKSYEVSCHNCGEWALGLRSPQKQAEKELRDEWGWKKTKDGWECNACLAIEEMPSETGKV